MTKDYDNYESIITVYSQSPEETYKVNALVITPA